VTVVVIVIFGRTGGLFSTSLVEALGSVAGARYAQEAKWCVPGVLGVAGGWILSPEKSKQANSSLISAEKPGGRRRSGGGEPAILDRVFSSSFRVFSAKKKKPYLQIVSSLRQVL
jgi:hypothetical protein